MSLTTADDQSRFVPPNERPLDDMLPDAEAGPDTVIIDRPMDFLRKEDVEQTVVADVAGAEAEAQQMVADAGNNFEAQQLTEEERNLADGLGINFKEGLQAAEAEYKAEVSPAINQWQMPTGDGPEVIAPAPAPAPRKVPVNQWQYEEPKLKVGTSQSKEEGEVTFSAESEEINPLAGKTAEELNTAPVVSQIDQSQFQQPAPVVETPAQAPLAASEEIFNFPHASGEVISEFSKETENEKLGRLIEEAAEAKKKADEQKKVLDAQMKETGADALVAGVADAGSVEDLLKQVDQFLDKDKKDKVPEVPPVAAAEAGPQVTKVEVTPGTPDVSEFQKKMDALKAKMNPPVAPVQTPPVAAAEASAATPKPAEDITVTIPQEDDAALAAAVKTRLGSNFKGGTEGAPAAEVAADGLTPEQQAVVDEVLKPVTAIPVATLAETDALIRAAEQARQTPPPLPAEYLAAVAAAKLARETPPPLPKEYLDRVAAEKAAREAATAKVQQPPAQPKPVEQPKTPEAPKPKVEAPRPPVDVLRDLMIPDNRTLFQKMAGGTKSFFIDKILKPPAFLAQVVGRNIGNKFLNSNDSFARKIMAPGMRLGILFNSAMISRQQKGWFTQRGSLLDLSQKNENLTQEVNAYKQTQDILKQDMKELQDSGSLSQTEKLNFELQISKIQTKIDKIESKRQKVVSRLEDVNNNAKQYEGRRTQLVEGLNKKMDMWLGPLISKLDAFNGQKTKFEADLSKLEKFRTDKMAELQAMDKKIAENPALKKIYKQRRKNLVDAIAKATAKFDTFQGEKNEVVRKMSVVNERAKPWMDTKDQFKRVANNTVTFEDPARPKVEPGKQTPDINVSALPTS